MLKGLDINIMSVLLHTPTQLPLSAPPIAASHFRSIELWLLTGFLFSLLIIGRLTANSATNNRLGQLPTSPGLLRKITPPAAPGNPDGPVPFFQPTAFYLPALTTTIQ